MTRAPIASLRKRAVLPVLLGVLAAHAGADAPTAGPPGIPNFHTVAPGITRGAAPTLQGLQALKAMGVQTVVDLRISPRLVRREAAEAHALGFRFLNLPMGSDPPTPRQVSVFLAALDAASPQHPVFVHCQHGADRTGCMVGIYREQQGWAFPRAWAEMRRYGFNPRWTLLTQAVRARAKT